MGSPKLLGTDCSPLMAWVSSRRRSRFFSIVNLRGDTCEVNADMNRQPEKTGFEYCGIIRVADDGLRVAYQKPAFWRHSSEPALQKHGIIAASGSKTGAFLCAVVKWSCRNRKISAKRTVCDIIILLRFKFLKDFRRGPVGSVIKMKTEA
ncbi:hypothetical protein [Pseudoramibacter alactolyticus]|uniref:hypothetical protein n=1 Tax=Pseudoramibacter alactolyticus TaxID=113287 RepID=UPI002355AADD|nr:hypothetical protein [Pseudoramibacter alactolyticus]MBM6968764.1 hypothetical protein [Pseudoramibacter alactolyticus]